MRFALFVIAMVVCASPAQAQYIGTPWAMGETITPRYDESPLGRAMAKCDDHSIEPGASRHHWEPKWHDCYGLERRWKAHELDVKEQAAREWQRQWIEHDQADWDTIHAEALKKH